MQFNYTPRQTKHTAITDAETFRIERLSAQQSGGARDVSHLVDRSYDYHSARELKWHLAERFGLPVRSVRLTRH